MPASEYRDSLPSEAHESYDTLMSCAAVVHSLDHVESTSTAHQEASVEMLGRSGRLFAVWDGQPARAYGGTADVVAAAREMDVPVTVIWPDGAWR